MHKPEVYVATMPYSGADISSLSSKDILAAFHSSFNSLMGVKEKPTFGQQLKSDAGNAAYRVAATQLMNGTRNLIVQQMRANFDADSKVASVAEMLSTDFGQAILEMVVGGALSQLSLTNKSPRLARLLKEFRVKAMTTAGNAAFSQVMQTLLPIFNDAFTEMDKVDALPEYAADESAQLLHRNA